MNDHTAEEILRQAHAMTDALRSRKPAEQTHSLEFNLKTFQPKIDERYQCPRCGIYRGRQADLRTAETGGVGLFRCDSCKSFVHE
jgi:hypothetical protein